MYRMRWNALTALLALGVFGRWGSPAAAQYIGGGAPLAPASYYAPVYYYVPGPGSYSPVYYYATEQAAGAYSYAAPAPLVPSSVVVPSGSSGWIYPAPSNFGRRVASNSLGLEPESLPAQIAEDTAPVPVAPRLGPTWRVGWWRGQRWRIW
jgi:hypothetical protein